MRVESHHTRTVPLTMERAGALLDGLASSEDRLWPRQRWPAMCFDGPLAIGASGGHGFVRYRVTAYEPGRLVRFTFDPAIGLTGDHWFELEPVEGGVAMSHHIVADAHGAMLLGWPLAVRWLHDALIRDAFDNAAAIAGVSLGRPFSPWVRLLRTALA